MSKICIKCKIEKPLDEFYNQKNKLDGKRNDCKKCTNAHKSIDEATRDYVVLHGKVCKGCNNHLPASEFYDRKSTIDGKFGKCKVCFNANQNERVMNDPDRFNKHVERVQRFREKHKDRLNNERRDRMQNDPAFKLRILLSKRVRDCVDRKSDSFSGYLGCSIEYFMKWFEFLFELNPSLFWKNHGTYWHYDHITPCNSFDLTNICDARKCFNWSNIRPCEIGENMAKGDKIIPELIQKYKNLANEFISRNGAPY